ncbi:MAG: hypothetical protein ACOYIP_06570 [Coriobacteriales bacterium]|jgi:hypothetical protein
MKTEVAVGGAGRRAPRAARIAVLLVLVMATALVQEAPHEFLGIALFVVIIVHIVGHRRYFANLARGRYTAVRVLGLVAIVGLLACIVGQLVSCIVLSKHALAFLPVTSGAAWARRVHMLCSYWAFVFAFAHLGLQVKAMLRAGKGKRGKSSAWAARIVFAAVAVYGAISFVQLGLGGYLVGAVPFAAADFESPLILICARWASVAVLVAGVFHYIRRILERDHAKRVSNGQGI